MKYCKLIFFIFLSFTSVVMAQERQPMTISRLFALTDSCNMALKVAVSEEKAAAEGVREAKNGRLPDIDASLSVLYMGNVVMTDRDFSHATAFSTPHWGNGFSIEAQQLIYAGGAVSAGIRKAEIQELQAGNARRATQNAQHFLAVAKYLEIMQADNAVVVYQNNIELTQRLISDIEAKRGQGMALRNDVTRYELQLENLKLGLRRMIDNRNMLNHQLCNLIGLATDVIIIPDTMLTKLCIDDEQTWQAEATACSPVLTNASLEMKAAEQQLRLSKSARLPKLLAFASDNFSGPYTYDIPPIDNNFNVWTIGLSITYSFSSLFKANKSVRKAGVLLRERSEAYKDAVLQVNDEMNEAHTLYLQSFADLRTMQKNVQLARENYVVANNRYLNDLALITDMIDASNIRLSAELDETNARISIVYAYYRMRYVAGNL